MSLREVESRVLKILFAVITSSLILSSSFTSSLYGLSPQPVNKRLRLKIEMKKYHLYIIRINLLYRIRYMPVMLWVYEFLREFDYFRAMPLQCGARQAHFRLAYVQAGFYLP